MTKSSCITHPASMPIVVVREDYVTLCDGNHCAAAVLNIFEYWTNIKLANRKQAATDNAIATREGMDATQDESLWIYKSQEELHKELFKLFGLNAIGKAVAPLIEKGYLQQRTNPRYKWDKTRQYLFNISRLSRVPSILSSSKMRLQRARF